jgi:MFS family permease
MFDLSRLAGPAIAGFVIAAYGAGFCFLIDGLSYLAVLGALSAMRLTLYRREKSRGLSVAQEFHEGLRYAWGFGPIRLLIFLMGCFSFFGMSYGVLVPVYAATVFSGDARVLGWMMSSSAAGALAGALFLAGRRELAGIGKCIRVGAVLLGISLLGFAFSRHLGLSCLLLVGAGLGVVLTAASSNTLVQNLVDEDKRGRVMSLYTLAFMGGMPLGSLLVGAAAEHAGATAATCLNGTACLVLAYVFFTHLPKIRAEAVAVLQSKGLMPS